VCWLCARGRAKSAAQVRSRVMDLITRSRSVEKEHSFTFGERAGRGNRYPQLSRERSKMSQSVRVFRSA
jgi:hypothetical protein